VNTSLVTENKTEVKPALISLVQDKTAADIKQQLTPQPATCSTEPLAPPLFADSAIAPTVASPSPVVSSTVVESKKTMLQQLKAEETSTAAAQKPLSDSETSKSAQQALSETKCLAQNPLLSPVLELPTTTSSNAEQKQPTLNQKAVLLPTTAHQPTKSNEDKKEKETKQKAEKHSPAVNAGTSTKIAATAQQQNSPVTPQLAHNPLLKPALEMPNGARPDNKAKQSAAAIPIIIGVVHQVLRQAGDSERSVQAIMKQIPKADEQQIRSAITILCERGHVCSTIDSDHYKAVSTSDKQSKAQQLDSKPLAPDNPVHGR
jgi:hypothetical protein